MTEKPQTPQQNPLRLFGTGLEFAGAVLILAFLGHLVDERWGTEPWGILTGAIAGLAGSMYNLFKVLNKANRDADTAQRKPPTDDDR